jgi:hypothetical protein
MPPSTIIDPKTDPQPRIFIPDIVEMPLPKNMPSEDAIQRWHEMAHDQTTVYKQKDAKPGSFNAKVFFKPTSLYPQHENGQGENLVTYKFNVAILTHRQKKEEGGNWVMHMVTDENGATRPNFITVNCKDFLDCFAAVQ